MPQPTPRLFPIIPTLDLVTPMFQKKPGVLIACLNHEPMADGVKRIDGYERIDGRTKASQSKYSILEFDGGTAAITAGQTVTGATSAASGEALADAVVESGSYGAGTAAGYLILLNVSGTFQDNENLQVAAATKSIANGTQVLEGAENDEDDATWKALAMETQRAKISTVPGEGSVWGAAILNGVTYAFRNNVGSTETRLYKSTASGWSLVSLGRRLAYTSGGTYEIQEGDTITGATSGATAVVTRITLTSETDATTGNAAGWIFFASQTGTFQAENLNVGANLNVATIAGNSEAITIPAGTQRYELFVHNFYALEGTSRIYGVNGVGPAFEFDGTVFVTLTSPIPDDQPTHAFEFEDCLFLIFRGGRMICSGDGVPYNFTAAFGAVDFGLGADCTGHAGPYAQSMFIYTRRATKNLYGRDAQDFQVLSNRNSAGAIEWTPQMVGKPIHLDDAGLRETTQGNTFGNFNSDTLTRLIEPYMLGKAALGVTAVGSVVVKRKSQYRLFFSDNSYLTVYFGSRSVNPVTGSTALPMILPSELPILCEFVQSFDENNTETVLMGSTDGYLYQLDSGYNFDGDEIEAYFRPAYDHCGSPEYFKHFSAGIIEGTFPSTAGLAYSAEYSYSSPTTPPSQERNIEIAGAGGFWSQASRWNEFNWSSAAVGKARAKLYGRGENLSLSVSSNMTYEQPYTISGMGYHYTLLRMNRMVG